MRHKWNKNIPWPDRMPDAVYKADRCEKCGLVCFHKCEFGFFTKTYLQSGVESDQLPECTTTKTLA